MLCTALTGGLALFALPASAKVGGQEGGAAHALAKSRSDVYLVRMSDAPVVAYTGGIDGLKATAPAKGKKIDPLSADVVKYSDYLKAKHGAALQSVGGGRKAYDYVYAVNGFAAELTKAQATAIAKAAGVDSVERAVEEAADTSTTPAFLGLTAPDGLWQAVGGVGSAGENVIVGVVDSGFWPEHPSFSDRTRVGPNGQEEKLAYQQIPGWHGKCTPGEDFAATHCNQKVIGAQAFWQGRGVDSVDAEEFLSARAWNSHGTHVASTAAGNANIANPLPFGPVSGMAPRARIAVYKVCFHNFVTGNCGANTADSAAAIDQAVADGVDVLNFSIGGSATGFLDMVQVAFFNAARAGIFVATSAGNDGPAASTVGKSEPWIINVAASTHSRLTRGSVTLGNGTKLEGASVAAKAGPASLVKSTAAGLAGADAEAVRLCTPGTLDAAKVTGKIVQCDRGVVDRVAKSLAVQQAKGIGMVLTNVAGGAADIVNDVHYVPTVHLTAENGAVVKAYIDSAGTGATATIDAAQIVPTDAPRIAEFSSRGPSPATGDILKPDISAPGVDVLAGSSPMQANGRLFDLLGGTSMASPHIAGIAALLIQKHPDWTPMMIKSALMTSATDLLGGDNSPFNQGAGHVTPNKAVDPGLVYPAGFDDWRAFLRSQKQCTFCFGATPAPVIDPSDYNQASIAIGDLAGVQTVKRRVTNVGSAAATYHASVAAPPGVKVEVTPADLTIARGETREFQVKFTRETATFGEYAFGQLTWSDGSHNVRSPLVVQPLALSVPTELHNDPGTTSTKFTIGAGYTGALAVAKRGLIPATKTSGTVADDPTDDFNTEEPDKSQGFTKHTFTIGAGTTYARFSLFDADTDGNDDIDLFVYDADGELVGNSGSPTSNEEVNLEAPAAGTYTVYVHGWETDGPDANYTLSSWFLGSADAGNMTVTGPSTIEVGKTYELTLGWSGLDANTRYLGALAYGDGSNPELARTIVRIDG